jgi:hypothetical protein
MFKWKRNLYPKICKGPKLSGDRESAGAHVLESYAPPGDAPTRVYFSALDPPARRIHLRAFWSQFIHTDNAVSFLASFLVSL